MVPRLEDLRAARLPLLQRVCRRWAVVQPPTGSHVPSGPWRKSAPGMPLAPTSWIDSLGKDTSRIRGESRRLW